MCFLILLIFSSRPSFLPDPSDGSLYVLGGKHKEGLVVSKATRVRLCLCRPFDLIVLLYLQKLPFTIPELVQSAPCKSSDGVLYTGETTHGRHYLEASACRRWHQSKYLDEKIIVCAQVKSRMCGSWWILKPGRSKPV